MHIDSSKIISGTCESCKAHALLYPRNMVQKSTGQMIMALVCYDCKYNKPIITIYQSLREQYGSSITKNS